MTDEFALTIKEILDKAGIAITMEQLEAGLNAMVDDGPKEDPWLDEVLRKCEEEHKNRPVREDARGYPFHGTGEYHVISGIVELAYHGKAHKAYQGPAALLVKPDDSLLVHGPRGIKPVCYMAKAAGIWLSGKDRKMIITAEAGEERLVVTFVRSDFFESLIKKLPEPERSSQSEPPAKPMPAPADRKSPLTEDQKSLEAQLKKLRIDLAGKQGITYLPAIFDNRMLAELVRKRPATIEELKAVRGMGEKRIGKYGDTILETIREAASGHT